jgi:FAD:protein FMN transferase
MRWSRHLTALLPLIFAAQVCAQSASNQPPIHSQKYAMGTVFEIVTYDRASGRATAAIDEAFHEIERLDDLMSNYKPQSELSRLNRNAHFQRQTVSRDLYRVIEQSLEYSRLSAGEFDISVGPLVDLWKAQQRGEQAITPDAENKARECVGFKSIKLLPPNRVEFRSPCLRIDVGAIGKGYAVDRAADILRSQGIHNALINAGGSTVYAMGTPPEKSGWTIELRDPSGTVRPQVVLKDSSVSTSEQTPRALLSAPSGGHIIDPQNGGPSKNSGAVSVIAGTATASDALSTTLLLVGPGRGKALISTLRGTAAVWISPEGRADTVSNGAVIRTSAAPDHSIPLTYSERSSKK